MNPQALRTLLTDTEALAWLSWIGLAIGLIGLALSYYFYKKGTRTKRPYCLTFTQSIAGKVLLDIPDFQITYKGHPIERLAITKLVFWNAGSETITSSDVPAAAPFQIALSEDAEFLSYSLEFVKRNSNAISMTLDDSKKNLLVEFDYLDKDDGFVVELLHTGLNDNAIKMQAIFKGAQVLVRRGAALFLSLPRPLRRMLTSEYRSALGISLLLAAIVQVADTYFHFMPDWFARNNVPNSVTEWFASVIVYGGFAVLGWYLWRTRLPAGFNVSM